MEQAGRSSGAKAHSEPREPLAESSSATSALDVKKEELIRENLKERKAALGDGQEISQVRKEVQQNLNINTKGKELKLVKYKKRDSHECDYAHGLEP